MKKTMPVICIIIAYLILYFWNGGFEAEAPIETSEKASQIVSEVSGNTRVYFVDVGQGDCELIESNGEFMLIDCGEYSEVNNVISYLEACGVTSLKYIIATHPHSDHMGGMATVIKSFDVENIIMPDKTNTTTAFEKMLEAIDNKGIGITLPVVGDVYTLGEGSFEIIAPYEDSDNLNNVSVGIKFVHGNNSFVMCGDAEDDVEVDICTRDISCNVLKLSHHGSSTSNSKLFLDSTNPEIVVISCGKNNSYGHPHKEVVAELESRDLPSLRTDELGTIVFESDGENISHYSLGSVN